MKLVRAQQWLAAHYGTGTWGPSMKMWTAGHGPHLPGPHPKAPRVKQARKAQGGQPLLAKSPGCQRSLWWQGTAEIKLGHQSAGHGLERWRHGCGSAGDQHCYSISRTGTNSPRLSGAKMAALAHGYTWWEAPGKVGQARRPTGALRALTKAINPMYGILGCEAAGSKITWS